MGRIAGDWHVGQTEQSVKDNAELILKNSLVILLEFFLPRRQVRRHRIIDKIKHQAAVGLTVTNFIENLQRADAAIERAFAALLVDIVAGIARQRTNEFDLLLAKKLRQGILSRLK